MVAIHAGRFFTVKTALFMAGVRHVVYSYLFPCEMLPTSSLRGGFRLGLK